MNEGDIALAPLPQADARIKNRPVFLLRRLPPFGDFLVCGISTRLQHRVADFDEVIAVGDPEFAASGLIHCQYRPSKTDNCRSTTIHADSSRARGD
jgi:mRNA interferase MazF